MPCRSMLTGEVASEIFRDRDGAEATGGGLMMDERIDGPAPGRNRVATGNGHRGAEREAG